MNPRPVLAVALTLAAGLFLSACGSSDEPAAPAETPSSASSSPSPSSPASTPAPTPAETGTTVAVTVRGDNLTPNAEKVKVKLGEKVTLDIDSDRNGEFHVHSTPEEEISFKPGQTVAHLKFDRPGLVDVEEHESGKLLVQFEVR